MEKPDEIKKADTAFEMIKRIRADAYAKYGLSVPLDDYEAPSGDTELSESECGL